MENLEVFLNTSKARLKAILKKLEWTESTFAQDLKATSKESEQATGQEDTEPFFPPNCATEGSLILGEAEFRTLLKNPTAQIPQKFSDLQLNFTREEKCLLYEHVIKNTKSTNLSPNNNEDLVSIADIVAMKKREKKKKKHRVSKPSHIEEVRNLVDLQMEALEQTLRNKSSNTSLKTNEELKSKVFERNLYTHRGQQKVEEKYTRRNSSEQQYDTKHRADFTKQNRKEYHNREKYKERRRSREREQIPSEPKCETYIRYDLPERNYCRDRYRKTEIYKEHSINNNEGSHSRGNHHIDKEDRRRHRSKKRSRSTSRHRCSINKKRYRSRSRSRGHANK